MTPLYTYHQISWKYPQGSLLKTCWAQLAKDAFTQENKPDLVKLAGWELIQTKTPLNDENTSLLLNQPPSQSPPPVGATYDPDSHMPQPYKDVSNEADLVSENHPPPQIALWLSMTCSLEFTRIGCTKILEHIWMVVLERMVSDKIFGKDNFFSYPTLLRTVWPDQE